MINKIREIVKRNRRNADNSNITINGEGITVRNAKNIRIENGKVTVDGQEVFSTDKTITVEVIGDINNLSTDGSANIYGDVEGDVVSGGSVNCDDVGGNVSAGGSVNCDDVGGNITAGGNVIC